MKFKKELLIDCEVDGQIDSQGRLTVGKQARIKGDIKTRSVIVDGTVNHIGLETQRIGGALRQVQTGRVQNYALGIALGLLVMAGSYLVISAR